MAVRGRKPKPQGQAVTRHKPTHEWTEVPDVPFEGAPRLPTRRMNGRPWSTRDRRAWKAWSTMPHCSLWYPATWEFAFDTMELAALMHDGDTKVAAEVRARQKVLGMTADARRDQRIRYVDPPAGNDVPADVARMVDYRDL
jgi:hypothetical protein